MDDSWENLFKFAFEKTGESMKDIIDITLTKKELKKNFDSGLGLTEGEPFLAWSNNYVYFPACYDGEEWVEFVPRNPGKYMPRHIGVG